MKSKALNRTSKLKIYKSLIRPIVTYGCEAWALTNRDEQYLRTGMSNMRPTGRMRPFASTPAARTKDTVIWSFNGQNCSFYNLNWINVRRSQKNSMLFFIQNVFYTWKYDRLFPRVKNILNKENSTAMQRTRLTDQHLSSLIKVGTAQTFQPNIPKIVIEKRCQASGQNTKND